MSERTIEYDFVMPITFRDDYDRESNDTCYNLENIYGINLENCDDNNCYTIGVIHTINDESDYAYDMQGPKLGDAMFNEDDIFSLPCFDEQIYYDDSMPLFMMIILMKVGLEECQL